jgi:hypothetical protein
MKVGAKQRFTLNRRWGRFKECCAGGPEASSFYWGLQRWGGQFWNIGLSVINSETGLRVINSSCMLGVCQGRIWPWMVRQGLWAPGAAGQQDPAVCHSHSVNISSLGVVLRFLYSLPSHHCLSSTYIVSPWCPVSAWRVQISCGVILACASLFIVHFSLLF